MYLEITIFVLILIMQVCIAAYSLDTRIRSKHRFSKALSSGINVSETLEEMLKLMDRFNLAVKVVKNLNDPALLKDGYLYVNKDSIYRSDLFSNYKVIYLVVLTTKSSIFRNISKYQNLLFVFNFIIFILGVVFYSVLPFSLINIAIVINVLLIILSFLFYWSMGKTYRIMHLCALNILKMDDVEEARSESLNKDLQLKIFEYPLNIFISLWEFLKP